MEMEIIGVLKDALIALKKAKPNDKGELDRRYAVTITEMEKVVAYFSVYVVWPNQPVEQA